MGLNASLALAAFDGRPILAEGAGSGPTLQGDIQPENAWGEGFNQNSIAGDVEIGFRPFTSRGNFVDGFRCQWRMGVNLTGMYHLGSVVVSAGFATSNLPPRQNAIAVAGSSNTLLWEAKYSGADGLAGWIDATDACLTVNTTNKVSLTGSIANIVDTSDSETIYGLSAEYEVFGGTSFSAGTTQGTGAGNASYSLGLNWRF